MGKKHQKKLDKICPECEEPLVVVFRTTVVDGVEYEDQFIECECGYKEKRKITDRRINNDVKKW